jgi:hypothetical protein
MPIFSDADIADLSGVVEELAFHDQYRLFREVLAYDEENNRIVTWTEIESGLGSLQARDLALAEQLLGDRATALGQYTFQCPRNSLIHDDDRVLIGSVWFSVSGVSSPSKLSFVKSAQLSEVVSS